MRFDLLVKGGEVVDPAAGYTGPMDVAVLRGRIAALDTNIPAESAFKVIDASGQFVVPGLIDMHAHLYREATFWGVDADAFGSRSGVTTWVDAGSSGAMNLQGFREFVIEPSRVRIFAFVNITSIGLVAQNYELTNPEYCNVSILKKVIDLHSDIVIGIKIRTGRSGGAQDLIPLERARRAADESGLPMMLHISAAPPDLKDVLGFLKSGDILTHCLTGQTMKLVDGSGKILPEAKKALDDGVLMDLGHGSGSFSFDSAEALAGQGYWPHFVSTDLHTMSVHGHNLIKAEEAAGDGGTAGTGDAASIECRVKGDGKPVFGILNCMDKMLYLGMPFPDIITATTSRPAKFLGLDGEVGTLRPGARADLAGLVVEKREQELIDIHGQKRRGKERVRHIFTVLHGKPFPRMEAPPPPPWIQPAGDEIVRIATTP